MKKFIFILLVLNLNLLAFSSIQASYAIGIFHENGNGENIQHKKITDQDYNATCFSKIVVFGKIEHQNIKVRIGNSLGYFENSKPIYNIQKILIGYEITFKHYNVSKGLFEVSIDGRIYDSKVFVK